MAPPYSSTSKIEIYTWQSGPTHFACQHDWHQPGIELPVLGGSSQGVVEKLQASLGRELRGYAEQWPYYAEELLSSTVTVVVHLSEPCRVHQPCTVELPPNTSAKGSLGMDRLGRWYGVEPSEPQDPDEEAIGVEAKIAHHVQGLLRRYATNDEELACPSAVWRGMHAGRAEAPSAGTPG